MDKFKRILLVEDSENDIELALDALSELNLANSIDIVRDGAEALDYLFCRGKHTSRIKENPLLILMDIRMPRLNGLETLEAIEREESMKTIPIMMVTTSEDDSDLMESYVLGTDTYVIKPLNTDNFMNGIKHLGIVWINVNKRTILLSKLSKSNAGEKN